MNSIINAAKRRAVSTLNATADLANKAGKALAASAVIGLTAVSGSAHAAPFTIDTTEIVATISAGVTAISAIGVAVISLVVVIKLYKWVQRVL